VTRTRAASLIETSLVWENHCCLPFSDVAEWMPQLSKYRQAGFDLVHLNVGDADIPLEAVVRTTAAYRAWLRERPSEYVIVEGTTDIEAARETGRLAICFDIEGAHALGTELSLISMFYDLGVRWLLMAYNCGNAVGAGCHDSTDAGLTQFGKAFVKEMDRVGMIKDVAHTGYRTARDVIEASTCPVNISHSNPRALHDHPRCVPDDLMRACSASGGVIGITGLSLFLPNGDIGTENFVHSIDYSVQVMGIDHVGIGLDFVFDQRALGQDFELNRRIWPQGYGYEGSVRFVAPGRLEEIVEALFRLGYSDADVRKVLGENFLRVARQVWRS
jgi:membrane dipeptidase